MAEVLEAREALEADTEDLECRRCTTEDICTDIMEEGAWGAV